jgi:hypothetical protein
MFSLESITNNIQDWLYNTFEPAGHWLMNA